MPGHNSEVFITYESLGPFVLRTTWGTFLCRNPLTGNLEQSADGEVSLNLEFLCRDGQFSVSTSSDAMPLKIDGIEIANSDWDIVIDKDGALGLKIFDRFATSIPNGALEFGAPAISRWERLTAVPLIDAVEILSGLRPLPCRTPQFMRRRGIPRVIHQTFPQNHISSAVDANISEIRAENPDYSYRIWTDKDCMDFIYTNYGYEILDIYLRINPEYGAARADLFRYLLLYREGGIYLDIKSGSAQALSNFILDDDEFLLGQWDDLSGNHAELHDVTGGEFQQWHISSSPGHPYLEAVINSVISNIHDYYVRFPGVGGMGVLRLTGPIAYTRAIFPILHLYPHRFLHPVSDYFIYQRVDRASLPRRRHYKTLRTPIVLNKQ